MVDKIIGKSSLESVKVVNAKSLAKAVRLEHDFKDNDFVEIRVERVNPASVVLVKLNETPGRKFSSLLKEASF